MRISLWLCAAWCALAFPASAHAGEQPRARYVSLAPATTEILFALGLEKEVVGVTTFCNYPPAAREKEKVGTFSDPNIEKIVSLAPRAIFCTGLEQAPAIVKLKQLHFQVEVSDPADLESLYASILRIGALTDRVPQAKALVGSMREEVEGIRRETAGVLPKDRPRVFVEYWNNPLMTAGPGSFLDELVRVAGGENIANDTRRPFSIFSPELVIRRDPQCIIMAYMLHEAPVKEVAKRIGWERISAVTTGRVYADIDPDILLRPGPRVVLGVRELHKRFYPGDGHAQ